MVKIMNIDSIKSYIQDKVYDENQLHFLFNGDEVNNRFDKNPKEIEEDSYTSIASMKLYSLTINSIIMKGSCKKTRNVLFDSFKKYFSKLKKESKEDISLKVNTQIDKAEEILSFFIENKENISLARILATYLPVVTIDLINSHEKDSRKIVKEIDSSKERIFNQATLYCRSTFHSLLSIQSFDQSLFSFDKGDVSNGIIYYSDTLLFSTEKDAMTFSGFKSEILKKLELFSKASSLANINKVGLLYLTKDIVVYFDI